MASNIVSDAPKKRRKAQTQHVKSDVGRVQDLATAGVISQASATEHNISYKSNFNWNTSKARSEKYSRNRDTSEGEHKRRNIAKSGNKDTNYGDRTSAYHPQNISILESLGIKKKKKFKDSSN